MKQLFRTSFLSGLSAIVKLSVLLILNKVLAIYVGPTGYAVIGQFQNFITIVLGFPASVNNGVVKFTAELDSMDKKSILWSTSIRFVCYVSIAIGLCIICFSNQLAIYFSLVEHQNVFLLFGIAYILYALNSLFIAILNGMGEIKSLVLSNISGSFLSLVIVLLFTYFWGLNGALIALVVNQSAVFFITCFLMFRLSWFKISLFSLNVRLDWLLNLKGYMLIAIISMLTAPTSSILVRNQIIEIVSQADAGYWDALIKLSSAYMMVLTTVLSIYFLPKFAQLKDSSQLKNEMSVGIIFFSVIFIIGGSILFYFKDFFILILFNKSFLPVTDLLGIQLISDFVKVLSWIFSFYMLSKALTVQIIITQIIHALIYVIFSFYLLSELSVSGVLYSSIIANSVYLFMCIFVTYYHIKNTYKVT